MRVKKGGVLLGKHSGKEKVNIDFASERVWKEADVIG